MYIYLRGKMRQTASNWSYKKYCHCQDVKIFLLFTSKHLFVEHVWCFCIYIYRYIHTHTTLQPQWCTAIFKNEGLDTKLTCSIKIYVWMAEFHFGFATQVFALLHRVSRIWCMVIYSVFKKTYMTCHIVYIHIIHISLEIVDIVANSYNRFFTTIWGNNRRALTVQCSMLWTISSRPDPRIGTILLLMSILVITVSLCLMLGNFSLPPQNFTMSLI